MPRAKKSTTEKVELKKKPVVKRVKKESLAKPKEEKAISKKSTKLTKFWEAIGRRKTASARVRIFTKGEKPFLVNGQNIEDYFKTSIFRKVIMAPIETLSLETKFYVSAIVGGGGISAQAEAVRHGLARALIKFNPNFRKKLKKSGFLTRDPRMKERKKFGLKRARKAPQWSKR